MRLRTLHRLGALTLAAYATVHIANHVAGLAGVETHIALMRRLRSVYRTPAVEAVLLASVLIQVVSGLTFVVRDWKRREGFIAWLQALSGAYLALFLLAHVGAVLLARATLGLDTNFYFAAAGFYVRPFQFFFAPYYFLAVFALFTHVGCAFYWRWQASRVVAIPMAAGVVLSSLIVLALAGAFFPVRIPAEYKATYDSAVHVSESRTITAPAPVLYDLIADYRSGHPEILPRQYFGPLEVLKGGRGAGTEIRFTVLGFGRATMNAGVISEPVPGNELRETLTSGFVTTYSVEPNGQNAATVTITTDYAKPGIGGWITKLFVTPYLHRVYVAELDQLARVASMRSITRR